MPSVSGVTIAWIAMPSTTAMRTTTGITMSRNGAPHASPKPGCRASGEVPPDELEPQMRRNSRAYPSLRHLTHLSTSGALAAVNRRLDIFGILVLSFVAGNFGGITRDLLIGAAPPAAAAPRQRPG